MPTTEHYLPQDEAEQIRELYRLLQHGTPRLTGPDGEELTLPISVYNILKEVARNMQMGRAVSIVPRRELFTTQMAANFLGCSRPHLVKLLETQKIPFQKTGLHRRVQYQDLLAYQKVRDKGRRSALDTLAREVMASGAYEGIPLDDGGSDE